MGPLMLLQIPICAESFITNRTRIAKFLRCMRLHVSFQIGFDVRLLANGAHFRPRLELNFDVFVRVGQAHVSRQAILVNELFSAVWATFWFVLVYLLVPFQFGL